ncbi:hypothetical protein [Rivularia sp. UHCC 0363]|uniref:hypothetical protein n=1 Tax=Rivularia sp. UHCC 0363 TaxID=3110244 RepID=UPI002B20A9FC|nr:hypothetical protein [Rivularia sp. UHCC 0363]MEA5598275.1 hypothetical protein [Rivularia sp. UHCC 0363]
MQKMLWKFVIGTLVLPYCVELEIASATIRKDVQIPVKSELELLSTQSEQAVVGETIPAINQHDYKISHQKRRYRKRNHYKPRHYQRRNHNPHYRRVNYRNNYQNCPKSRSRRVNYHPASYRQEAYPINNMIYRRHYYRRH